MVLFQKNTEKSNGRFQLTVGLQLTHGLSFHKNAVIVTDMLPCDLILTYLKSAEVAGHFFAIETTKPFWGINACEVSLISTTS